MNRRGYNIFRCVDLSIRKLLGELSDQEREEYTYMVEQTGIDVSKWSGEMLRRNLIDDLKFDRYKAYKRFKSEVSTRKVGRWNRVFKMAAVWMLPILIGGTILWLYQGEAKDEIKEIISPVSAKAYVELADGRRIDLSSFVDNFSEKDGTLIHRRDSGELVYTHQSGSELIYNVLNVPRGGEFTLVLSDGTKVWINSDSRLRYPVQFAGGKREVYLQGEAYFDVAEDAEHPFIVHASLGQVEVLGTEFNVQDYVDETNVAVTLVDGAVEYSSGSGKGHRLQPGFQLTDSRIDGEVEIREVNTDIYVRWKDGVYVFYDNTLEEIMKTIGRNYDVDVEFSEERLKFLRFSGELEKYDKVEEFLFFVELGGDVVFHIDGKKIRIEPK